MDPSKASRIQKMAALWWMLGLVFSLVGDIHKLVAFSAKQRQKALSSSPPSAGLSKNLSTSPFGVVSWLVTSSLTRDGEEASLCRAFIQDALDLTLPMTVLELIPLSSGSVGMIGCITSLLGAYSAWPSSQR